MRLYRRLPRIAVLVLSIAVAAVAWAQDTASITGTVTDSSGAAIPHAQVVITDPEKGITRTSVSNESGDYLFASLPIGSYDLIVTSEGFKKYQAKGVILRVAEKARVNVALQVGTISTEVVVQGSEVAQVKPSPLTWGGRSLARKLLSLN
jgi:fructose-1-phosphate kinase PfkB-like protein